MYIIEDKEEQEALRKKHEQRRVIDEKNEQDYLNEEFKIAFRYITKFYRCPRDEIELLKVLVRKNPKDGATGFVAMYKLLLGPCYGFNERLRADIEKTRAKEIGGNDSRTNAKTAIQECL